MVCLEMGGKAFFEFFLCRSISVYQRTHLFPKPVLPDDGSKEMNGDFQ